MSTGTLRRHSHGITTLDETGKYVCDRGEGSEFYAQRRHAHREPEILMAENVLCTQIPCLSFRIIQVTKYGEDP